MKNFLLRLFSRNRFQIEILQNGKRIFGATERDLENLSVAHPGADGAKGNIGKGVQLRVTRI